MSRPRFAGRLAKVALLILAGMASGAGPKAPPIANTGPDTTPDWLPEAARSIAAREYEASQNREGLQAPNRAQNLRTYFEPEGVRVHDRTDDGSPALLGLRLTGMGRAEPLALVQPGVVTSDGARVEIRRPQLTEWFLNSEAGLEQGFTLAERPTGEGELVLELALDQARASLAGDRVILATGAGRKLAYGGLVAIDARGTTVLARFELPSPERLRLVIDDGGAAYPLTIDPLLTQTADTQLEGDQNNVRLGISVANAGDVNGDGYADVIVGADHYDSGQAEEGAAFIFLGSASGIASAGASTAAAQLEGDVAAASFGFSVAGAGDVNGDGYDDVIVGAPTYVPFLGVGAAFVFHGSASGIASAGAGAAATQLDSSQAGADFGLSVAGAGDVNGDGYADVIVGAYAYDFGLGDTNEGAAFVFLGSASGVADATTLTAHAQIAGNQVEGRLGNSVAGAGDVNGDGYADVIVGARLYDAGESDEGIALVFLGSSSGISGGGPGAAATLLQSNLSPANFGMSVAGAGDVNGDGYADVIVGAKNYSAGQSLEGAAFVFLGSASGIPNGNPTTAAGQLESDQVSALLGNSVSGAGDVNGDGYADVIAGAPFYDGGDNDEGAVFVWLGGPTAIANGHAAAAFARLESGQADAWLGYHAAGAGDVNADGYADVIGGAYLFDAGESNEGAAFVYLGGAQGIVDGNPATAIAQLESNVANSGFGFSLASAGDVNGDGYGDVIVGAYQYDAGQLAEGAAFVFLGSATGIASGGPSSAATQLESNQSNSSFGHSVGSAGDVNGDGYGDVIVGAYNYNVSERGAAFVFHGSATGIASGGPASAATQLESSNQSIGTFGWSVASAGDVNGDGYADVIVGDFGYHAGELDEGAAFVFLGSASGVASGNPSTAAAHLESNQAEAVFGFSVASAGDVNGDGYADVIVGAWLYDAGQQDEGAAFVFLGGATGIASGGPSSAATQLEANQVNANLGRSVASAGDVNGDGFADVIVGGPLYAAGQTNEGAAFVFHGSASGIPSGNPSTAATQLEGNQDFAEFGSGVASAGDVNGDGYADVIVGAFLYDAGETNEGAAFVFLGSSSGVASGNPASAAAQLESNQSANGNMGMDVASAGDVNGDGFGDVLVGAHLYDAGQQAEGAAFLFYGNGNRTGRPVLARQLRGDGGSLPVQPWGGSYDSDDFQVRTRATHPEGRGRVKLQVQACPDGAPFGHASCTTATSPTWTDVTATGAGVTLTQTVAGLAEGTLYHWRARVLHVPYTVTQSGITSPPNPAHGPWRRLSAQAVEADLRVWLDSDGDGTGNTSDTDDDNDGLLDIHETDTGIYVSPTNTGSDPLDSDSDDDGLLDGADVALGSDPNNSDIDEDLYLDGADNCPLIQNGNQANGDTWAAGDACQCGDVTGDGVIAAADYQLARQHVVKGTVLPAPDRCDVNGDDACDVEDLAVLERLEALVSPPPPQLNGCDAYGN